MYKVIYFHTLSQDSFKLCCVIVLTVSFTFRVSQEKTTFKNFRAAFILFVFSTSCEEQSIASRIIY